MNITHITYYIPESKQSIRQMDSILQSEAAVLERIMGLNTVPRDQSLTYPKLLNTIFDKLKKEYQFELKSIRYVLFAHTADEIAPQSTSVLSDFIRKNGLEHAVYFGLSAHKCASAFQAMIIARTLLLSLSRDDIILILIADVTFTPVLQYIAGSTVLGDAGCAVLLQKRGARHCVVDIALKEVSQYARGAYDSKAVQLRFQGEYTDHLCDVILSVLTQNSLTLSDIKIIFPHNVNIPSWKNIASRLNIPFNKIYLDNVSKMGHCFGSDPFINLKDALVRGCLLKGDYYLLVTVGLGASFAVALMQC